MSVEKKDFETIIKPSKDDSLSRQNNQLSNNRKI